MKHRRRKIKFSASAARKSYLIFLSLIFALYLLPQTAFANDIDAMEVCDTCVLVLPCGRSAHTEAGWFAGKGRTTIAYIPEKQEPELMYKLFSAVCCSMDELIDALK